MIGRMVLALLCLCGSQWVMAGEPSDETQKNVVSAGDDGQAGAASEAVLDSMTVSSKKVDDPHTRTELGKLTEATPISGSVVTPEDIEHLQLVNNLLELGKRIPGISMVRNMRIPDGGKQYTENRIDGMRAIQVNTSVLDEVDMANVDHVEVITGPGSALYGSGSLGGTINIFTRQPPRDLKARLSQELGSWGFTRSQGFIGDSFADGRIGIVATGSTMDNDGWRRNNAPENSDAAAEHKNGLAFKTVIRPFETTKITLGADQLHYDYRWAGTLPMNTFGTVKQSFNKDWRRVVDGTYGQSVDDYETKSIRLQQMIGDTSEFNIAYARRTDDGHGYGSGGSGGSNNVICDDGTSGFLKPGKTVKCSAFNHGSRAVTNTLKKSDVVLESTTALFRKEFDLAKSTLYLGMDYWHITTDSRTYNNAYTASQAQSGYWAEGTLNSAGNVVQERDSTPYVHFEFSPLDKLRLHIGERFDRITYTTDDRTSTNKDIHKTYTADIMKTGVTYDFTPNHLIWGNWSESFNAPASSTLLNSTSNGVTTLGANLDPEKSDTYELGLRGDFREVGAHYDVTFYHTTNKGFVVSRECTPTETTMYGVGTCKVNENAGQLTTRGMESVYSWAVNPWLDLGATYTWSQAYYDKYVVPGATTGTVIDYSGHSYQAMPRHRLNLRLAVKPAPGWKVELEGDHISEYYVDSANSGTYSRPNLFNLRASYRSKDWSFWLHALNLTDRHYATRVGYSTIAGKSVLAASAGQGNAGSYTPLTVRVGVSYDF